jgi:hypothetical protein
MKLTDVKYYDGSREKICKLGLADLYLELQEILISTKIELLEEKQANGAAEIRKALDDSFLKKDSWEKLSAGGIDWKKRVRYNRTFIAQLGVEVQVSSRSDLLIRDIVHLRNSIQIGEIEVGIIIVPNNRLQSFLPDRTPSFKDAIKYIEEEFKEAMNFPIIILAVEHDSTGNALKKQKRKS